MCTGRTHNWLLGVTVMALAVGGCGDDDDGDSTLDLDAGPGVDGSPGLDAGGETDTDAFIEPSECGASTPSPSAWDCESDPGVTLGDPIEADAMSWTWVGFDDAFCMDGSTTGIGVNINPDSDGLLIMMEGGGACFDTISCFGVANPDGYGESKFSSAGGTLGGGLFARGDADNPFADWSYVYVPYCSGDAHSGTNADGTGGRTQTGHLNYQAYIARIAATFPDVSQVVLGGRSAGGLGVIVNYPVTASAFGCTPVHMLNDSGALMEDEYLHPCLQSQVREEWGVAVPSECSLCTCDDGGGLVNSFPHLARRYPDRRFAFMSYTADGTFRQFFSYGYVPACNRPATMPPEDYEAGLIGVRDLMSADSNFRTYYVPGDSHTFTYGDLSNTEIDGVTLNTWVDQFVEGDAAWTDVGP